MQNKQIKRLVSVQPLKFNIKMQMSPINAEYVKC